MNEKQQEDVCTGVMVGVVEVDGVDRAALHVIAGDVNATVVLNNHYAISLFDSLGATLDSLGLLDANVPGGAPCRKH